MSTAEKHTLDRDSTDLIMQSMASLGVTPQSIQQALIADSGSASLEEYLPLADEEWRLIEAPLPQDATQSHTMDNRTFVNAVLSAMHRGRWTDHREQGPQSDAVRRRFGRWAHQGIWQRLYIEVDANDVLSPERKSELEIVARRAERLRLNA